MAFDHTTFRSNITTVQSTLDTLQTQLQAIEDQIQAHVDNPAEDDAEVTFTSPLRHFVQQALLTYGPRVEGDSYRVMEGLKEELQARFDESTDISP